MVLLMNAKPGFPYTHMVYCSTFLRCVSILSLIKFRGGGTGPADPATAGPMFTQALKFSFAPQGTTLD